ncbi:hypothetical protein ACEWY4_019727 [Coilia grayii]|uniref:Protein S100 n=1 Tax=Coilia grayii TaxID=363190 RepID=A0ABD1JAW9_9TELE
MLDSDSLLSNGTICILVPRDQPFCLIMSLMAAMATIITVFEEHAGKDGDASTLSNAEVKGLLCKEFGAKMETAKDKQAAEKMFQELDGNKDGKVDFTEFVTLVAAFTAIIKESLK